MLMGISLGEGLLHLTGGLIGKTYMVIKSCSWDLADGPLGKCICQAHLRTQVQILRNNNNNNLNKCVPRVITRRQEVEREDIAENSTEPGEIKSIQGGCLIILHSCQGIFRPSMTPHSSVPAQIL